ncbi:hypothetical protein, partial [Staphylococcus massiliensis]
VLYYFIVSYKLPKGLLFLFHLKLKFSRDNPISLFFHFKGVFRVCSKIISLVPTNLFFASQNKKKLVSKT